MAPTPVGALAIVDVPDSCGNAPRKAIIRDFTIALYGKRVHEVAAMLKDDVRWQIVGSHLLTGIEQVQTWMTTEPGALKLTIHTIITHGSECVVEGTIEQADGTMAGFCHVIIFAGAAKTAKIKEIRSYTVGITE